MSFTHGPLLPTTGLISMIDPRNSRCYSGSGDTLTDIVSRESMTKASSVSYSNPFLEFTTDTDYLTRATTIDWRTQSFTWAAWVRADEQRVVASPLISSYHGTYGLQRMCHGEDGSIFFEIREAGSNASTVWKTAAATFTINAWHLVTITRNYPSAPVIYIDGSLVSSTEYANQNLMTRSIIEGTDGQNIADGWTNVGTSGLGREVKDGPALGYSTQLINIVRGAEVTGYVGMQEQNLTHVDATVHTISLYVRQVPAGAGDSDVRIYNSLGATHVDLLLSAGSLTSDWQRVSGEVTSSGTTGHARFINSSSTDLYGFQMTLPMVTPGTDILPWLPTDDGGLIGTTGTWYGSESFFGTRGMAGRLGLAAQWTRVLTAGEVLDLYETHKSRYI